MEPSSERARNAVKQFVLDMLPSCRQIVRESNLTTTDLQVLHLIHLRDEPTTASRLCSLSGLPTSTMTRILDRLEDGGYIKRSADSTDRRIRIIETVHDQLEPIVAHFDDARRVFEGEMSTCSDKELQRMFEFLSGVATIQLLLSRSAIGSSARTGSEL